MPEIAHSQTLADLLKKSAQKVILDPGAAPSLSAHLAGLDPTYRPTRDDPLQLVFGPEGGLSPSELEACARAGATAVRISAHTLRIETAAQGALAIASERWLAHM